VHAIRDLDGTGVSRLAQQLAPRLNNSRQHCPASIVGAGVWYRPWHRLVLVVQLSCVAAVEEHLREGNRSTPLSQLITSLIGDKFVNVSANVPAPQAMETPVGLYSGQFAVVVVISIICCSYKLRRDGIAEEYANDAILLGIRVVLVESHNDKGVFHYCLSANAAKKVHELPY
jgi:hypothetical protein